jgi:hypothetical protein
MITLTVITISGAHCIKFVYYWIKCIIVLMKVFEFKALNWLKYILQWKTNLGLELSLFVIADFQYVVIAEIRLSRIYTFKWISLTIWIFNVKISLRLLARLGNAWTVPDIVSSLWSAITFCPTTWQFTRYKVCLLHIYWNVTF